ncbi:hypothetical protein EVAR_3653_1 [Eumeta japonica]|uniref:Uncharacterized protein n=1 Tax=Eumeta variegata TaxID=151549 RepID=A0A4C1SU03_EUMVA|nr:hypothetical protein EVAR_3653_1 [Eumeta japonica]
MYAKSAPRGRSCMQQLVVDKSSGNSSTKNGVDLCNKIDSDAHMRTGDKYAHPPQPPREMLSTPLQPSKVQIFLSVSGCGPFMVNPGVWHLIGRPPSCDSFTLTRNRQPWTHIAVFKSTFCFVEGCVSPRKKRLDTGRIGEWNKLGDCSHDCSCFCITQKAVHDLHCIANETYDADAKV